MKGIIFNLLEEVLTAEHGPHAWPDLVDAAGVGGVYTSLGSYPDADVLALVDTAAAATGQSANQVLHWFGRHGLPLLATRFPHFWAGHSDARGFISSLNTIIHPEVRKLYTGAVCPHFHFSDGPDGALLMGYQSPRRMCALAEGMITGASDLFGQTVTIAHQSCMLDGQPLCRLAVRWPA